MDNTRRRKEILKRIKMLDKNAVLNRENYNKNRIKRDQYHIRKGDMNNRIAELRRELQGLRKRRSSVT